MGWDASDSIIEGKFTELISQEVILREKLKTIRMMQGCINSLKMAESEQVNPDGTRIFELPKNHAGNEMNSDYRNEQKIALTENIDAFLGQL